MGYMLMSYFAFIPHEILLLANLPVPVQDGNPVAVPDRQTGLL